jgi:heme/copper-type cytochrome/quinol oxidase subunit 2
MTDQQPGPYPAQTPGAPQGYVPPQAREISVTYRRWANILVWAAAVIALFVVVASVLSVVFLVQADADSSNAALGYLAIVLWVGIFAAIPVLLGVGIPGLIMKLRVRRWKQAQASDGAAARP